jgi:hypothetical protein
VSPVDARIAQLATEIAREWDHVVQQRTRAVSVDPGAGDAEAALVALSLDHAYQAFESLLVRVERALGLAEREGPTWHVALLDDAGHPIERVRPALYPPQAASAWDQLLRFRHFLRHAYAVPLDPERLRANVARLTQAVDETAPYVEALAGALLAD